MAAVWGVLSVIIFLSCLHMNATSEKACSKWATMDIVFLVSESLLKGSKTGSAVKSFLLSLVDSFYLGEDKIQIGLSTLTTGAIHIAFLLKTSHQLEDIKTRIRSLSPQSNWTMVGDNFLVFDQFSEAAGGRYSKGVPQIAVYITVVHDTLNHRTKALLNHRITVHSIEYYSQTKEWTMDGKIMKMQKTSSDKNQDIFQKLSDLLCDSAALMLPLDKGPHAVCTQGLMADILFVVDGPSSVGWLEFEVIKDFLYILVDRLYVGPDQVQLGLVKYTENFQAEFRFNTYQTKTEILRHLRRLRQIHDTKIGLGRDFLSSHYFTGAAGSRAIEGVPQIVVVITSSRITSPVKDNLLELKTHGINVYAIGIGCKVMGDFLGVADKKYCVEKNFFDLLQPNQDRTASFIDSLCGMAKQHWLNIVLEPAGQGNAMVDNRVTLKRGQSLIVQCHYDEKYKDHVKYWCRVTSESACSVIVRSDAPRNRGNVSINDHPHQHLFNVIIKNLQTMDSAIYLCGVETSDMEPYVYIADLNLIVTAGTPALLTHNNNAVVEIGGNVIFQCMYSEENAHREEKWCRRGDCSSCLTETETRNMTGQDGVKLHNDKKHRILTVVIRGVVMNTTGWYWCTAGNQHLLYQINVLPQKTTFTAPPEMAGILEAFTVSLDLVLRPVQQRQILLLLFLAATVLVYLVCTIVAVTKIWAYCKQKKDEALSLTTQIRN